MNTQNLKYKVKRAIGREPYQLNTDAKRHSPKPRRPFSVRRNVVSTTENMQNHLRVSICHAPRRFIIKPSSLGTGLNHNQRENIRVVIRVRPPNQAERVAAHRVVVEVEDENVVVFDPKEAVSDFYFHGRKQNNNTHFRRFKDARFVFDRVFAASSTNEAIFTETIQQNLDSLLEGFNCSIFAYGATGSGKTFTMLGSGPENPGLTILTLMDLYQRLEKIEAGYHTSVSVSYLEVYNETVRDLLAPPQAKSVGLNILEDENGVSVPNLTTLTPEGQSHLLQALSEGNRRRTQHPTDHNAESSRSHAVFQVHLTIRAKFEDVKRKVLTSKLVMVDLAGSERASATRHNMDRSREGASINKSLLALGNCINALADGKKHVPYRDSKLTRLLKDSLGGNCKTIVIANVSPSSLSYDDTFNTLKYADRAKHIRVNVKKNEVLLNARMAEYAKVVQDLQGQVSALTGELDLYKTCCKCLSSASHTSTSDSEESETEDQRKSTGRNVTMGLSFVTPPADDISVMKGIKRRYQECKGSLSLADSKVEVKRARLEDIAGSGDWKAPDAVQRLRKQLAQLEQTRESLVGECKAAEKILEEAIDTIPPQETVVVPLREMMRLHGIESQHDFMLKTRDRETQFLKDELDKKHNLLVRAMKLATDMYQVNHVHGHTTKLQDAQISALRLDYLGLNRQVRWTDNDDEPITLSLTIPLAITPVQPTPTKTNLNTTFEILPMSTY